MFSQLIKDGLRHQKARRRPLQVSLDHFLSRNRFGYVVPALNWAGGCSCSILQFNYQAYVLLLDIHLNTEPCPCTQWFILQAYEKEDEAPAAAPAEKKEKVAEKVMEECATELNRTKFNCHFCIVWTNLSIFLLQAETKAAPAEAKKAKAGKAKK